MRTAALRLTVLVAAIAASSCGGGTSSTQQPQASNAAAPAANRTNASVNKADYPVFPNADAGADPAVPAEQGGKGFKGEGWQTNADYELIGSTPAEFQKFLRKDAEVSARIIAQAGAKAN